MRRRRSPPCTTLQTVRPQRIGKRRQRELIALADLIVAAVLEEERVEERKLRAVFRASANLSFGAAAVARNMLDRHRMRDRARGKRKRRQERSPTTICDSVSSNTMWRTSPSASAIAVSMSAYAAVRHRARFGKLDLRDDRRLRDDVFDARTNRVRCIGIE